MRSYWIRILLGALAVFAIGMVGVMMFRRGRAKVTEVVAGTGPLTIPLPFVPFQLDGSRLGTIERLVVNRDAPKKVASVDLQVKLDDSLLVQGLAGCRLAANLESDSAKPGGDVNLHVNRLGDRAFFFCAKGDSALVPFGTVTLTPGDVTVPLLVPQSLAETLHEGRWGEDRADSADVLAERADSIAGAAEAMADSIQDAQRDQQREQRRQERSRLTDSLKAEGLRRADSIRTAVHRMADSLQAR
jgi:hypothetical protein